MAKKKAEVWKDVPGQKGLRQAKKDYHSCYHFKLLSETSIDYEGDRNRSSTVILDVCGEKSKYDCSLSSLFSSDAPATYDCYEAEVDLHEAIERDR